MASLIAGLALLATFYQLYLQRRHNEKSLKPLGQIKFIDQKAQLAVQIENFGLGPMIIESLSFSKEGKVSSKIDEYLALDSRSFFSASIDSEIKKVLPPNGQMDVFAKDVSSLTPDEIDLVRGKLSIVGITLVYRDIYNNQFTAERSLQWFSRHIVQECSVKSQIF